MEFQSGKMPGVYEDTAKVIVNTIQRFITEGDELREEQSQAETTDAWLGRLEEFLWAQMNNTINAERPVDRAIFYGIRDITLMIEDGWQAYDKESWWLLLDYKLIGLRNWIDDFYRENIMMQMEELEA